MNIDQLVIDTNLLVLYVVGTAGRNLITKHKKLAAYLPEDYDALLRIIDRAAVVLVTPNTLTETSNLATYIAEPARTDILSVLRAVVRSSEEVYVSGKDACERTEYIRLGLTDAALLHALGSRRTLLTVDLDLHLAALSAGQATINFNEVRDTYLGPVN